MLDRTVAPVYQSIKDLALIEPLSLTYKNNLQTFVFQDESLDLLKFEFVFNNIFDSEEEQPLFHTAMAALFKEGTIHRNSAEIASQVDFYGAFLMPEYSFDHTSLTLYTMHKYVDHVLPIVSDILQNSLFPQRELETYVRNNKQSLQISLQKNDFIARRLFYQNLLGNNRYGVVPTEEIYDQLGRDRILELFKKQIQPQNCTLFIAGRVNEEVLNRVETYFGESWQNATQSNSLDIHVFGLNQSGLLIEDKEDSLQSAIRMGGLTINRSNPDFPALQFANTLLGGFFGSRLMRNIREDKGYTYSIGSAIANLKYTGFFTLASEVGVEVTQKTLSEIEKEFALLRQEAAGEEEIDLVRNYLQGVMLGSLESVFSHVDKFKAVYFSGLDLSYYQYYSDVISNMTASKVQDIAIEYLDYDKLLKVVVGKNK